MNLLGLLLQLRPDAQGQELARRFHRLLITTFPAGRKRRLNVVYTNVDAQPFWDHLGYQDTGQRKLWCSPTGLAHDVVLLALDSYRFLTAPPPTLSRPDQPSPTVSATTHPTQATHRFQMVICATV